MTRKRKTEMRRQIALRTPMENSTERCAAVATLRYVQHEIKTSK
jgi:glycerol-3-phosphate cytidylyltransferase-like family protein